MAISLRQLWPIDNLRDYKVHFGRRYCQYNPLDEWVRDRAEWRRWQQTRPGGANVFNRRYIFSLMDFYHEEDI